jgi:uncharacterized protein DUF433
MMGKPVIAGTRITVELILEKLAAGETAEQLLEAHPRLTREGILAAPPMQPKPSATSGQAVRSNILANQNKTPLRWERGHPCPQACFSTLANFRLLSTLKCKASRHSR